MPDDWPKLHLLPIGDEMKEQHWFVEFEARPHGAIGEFSRRSDTVLASSWREALDRGQRALNLAGYETRFPIAARPVSA